METREVKVFQYDELSERAQDKARYWYAESISVDLESTLDDIKGLAALFGLTIESVNYSIGDHGSFYACKGSYTYRKGALAAVRKEVPQDKELHGIVSDLQTIQKRHFYSLSASLSIARYSNSTNVDNADCNGRFADVSDATLDEMQEIFHAFSNWAKSLLTADYEDQTSAETMAEDIRCNKYTFLENGERF